MVTKTSAEVAEYGKNLVSGFKNRSLEPRKG